MVSDFEKCTEKLIRQVVSYTCILYSEMGIISWKSNDCKYFCCFIDLDTQIKKCSIWKYSPVPATLVFPWYCTLFSLYNYPQSSASKHYVLSTLQLTTYFGATAVRVINAKFWKQNNMTFNTIGKHLGILIYLTWILPIPPSFSDFHFSHCPALLVRRLMSLQLIPSLQASIFNIHPERWIPEGELLTVRIFYQRIAFLHGSMLHHHCIL